MNRTNLKILILLCAPATVISWIIGYLLFAQPTQQEKDDLNQAQSAADSRAGISADADRLRVVYADAARIEKATPGYVPSISDATIEAREEWQIAQRKANLELAANQTEQDSWNISAAQLRASRHGHQLQYTHAAIGFASAGILFFVLLFITSPRKT